jgi:hypothetical protein
MVKGKGKRKQEPTVAPGMDDREELEQKPTEEEMKRGDYTEVTALSWDEVDSS